MRGLFGDFSTMPLKDLVVYLGNKRATGTLLLERSSVRKQLAIKEGMVLSASSNEPREFLGQFLINMGYITEDQFNKAYQTQKETKVFLGRILVMIGLVSEQVVMTALSLKIRETLLDAFRWEDGTFNFDAAEEPKPPEGVDLQIDLLDIHREGEFRDTAWQAIRAAFPGGSCRLELSEKNLAEPPKPGSLDARLIELIKLGHTIDELLLALHATDFYLYQRLYALYRLEAVRVADSVEVEVAESGPADTVGEESGVEEILGHAEAFLDSGAFAEAEALAKRANELAPSSRAVELLRRAEAGLAKALRERLLDGGRVATLLVTPGKLRELQMTPPEKYLLSRVDGSREVASIVHVSPLRELDALKYFEQFVRKGLVKIEPSAKRP
ncbi:MAG: DUF4388 domain-containing protein [Myxococcales bacterium]|nr:DUF4388 domain-containing protein [Myxococcales bacterium]